MTDTLTEAERVTLEPGYQSFDYILGGAAYCSEECAEEGRGEWDRGPVEEAEYHEMFEDYFVDGDNIPPKYGSLCSQCEGMLNFMDS
jgi:hypothetical protein